MIGKSTDGIRVLSGDELASVFGGTTCHGCGEGGGTGMGNGLGMLAGYVIRTLLQTFQSIWPF